MARVLITGSADGLGRLAAQSLLDGGHQVVVHARDRDRLTAVRDLVDRGAATVVGDLSDLRQTRATADQVNDSKEVAGHAGDLPLAGPPPQLALSPDGDGAARDELRHRPGPCGYDPVEKRLTMTIAITAWDRSPDGGMGLARDARVRCAFIRSA